MGWLNRLRLQHLRLLVALSESGSLTRAAQLAHTTQPGLSKWLKDLEDEAGATLFARHARGMRPTLHGRLVLGYARRILSQAARAEKDLRAIDEGYALSIVVGVSPAASTLLPVAILAFLKRYPLARLEVREGTMDFLLQCLERDEIDVVVGRLDNYPLVRHLRHELLCSEPLCMVVRPGHPLVCHRRLQWSHLYDYDWIVWPVGSPIRSKLDAALTKASLGPPPYRVESSSQGTNLCLLQDSDMVSVASLKVAQRFAAKGLMEVLDIQVEESGSIGMCWRDEPPADEAITAFLSDLRQAAREAQLNSDLVSA